MTYNAAGGLTEMQYGNGRWESTQYNERLQPTQIALGYTPGNTSQIKLNYSYGGSQNNGNVSSQSIEIFRKGDAPLVFNQTYQYDELNRLKDATETTNGGGQTWRQVYTFDRYGNRNFGAGTTTLGNCPTQVCNPSISQSNNRITSSGWVYDSAGNTTTDGSGQTFTYDSENKQVGVKNSSNVLIGEYSYDGDGKRVKKVVPSTGETTVFVYDAAGKSVAEYSTVVAPVSAAKVQYLTNDHLGSPRLNTDKYGNVVARTDYMPYGEEVFGLGGRIADLGYVSDDVRQGFTGYINDEETGLDFAQARMYAKGLGRFTTVDPLMASAKTIRPESWNRYAYCYNNPLALIDPDGMDVQLLDEKAKLRVLSTLPEAVRNKVAKQIDKKGNLKKGSLDKIKSDNANFLDLKSAVDAKGTLEVATGNKDPRNGDSFFYKSDKEERKEVYENLVKAGVSPAEAKKETDEIVNDPNKVRSMGLGVTQSPTDKGSPNGNFRVVLSDGRGDASDAPQSDFAAVSAHEVYGHGLPGMQGKPWKHEYNEDPKKPGPVDSNIKQIEQRTRGMYKKPR